MPPAPFSRVDHLVIAVRDLSAAERAYATLLGRDPSARGTHHAVEIRSVSFGLANCSIALVGLATTAPIHPLAVALAALVARAPERLFAIAFGIDPLPETAATLRAAGLGAGEPVDLEVAARDGTRRDVRLLALGRERTRGVNVFAIAHEYAAMSLAPPRDPLGASVLAIDHVVIVTDDLTGALGLWRDAFAIPERWRHEFPERGTVNVGLRLGGLTLELVAPLGAAAGERGDRLWGVAYAVRDCASAVTRLRAAGVSVGDPRPGLAPATRVASVKRADGIPTLLIEHIDP